MNSPLRPSYIEVDLAAIQSNYLALREFVSPAKLLAVVKANAYGHGLVPVAKQLEQCHVDYLGVALVEEAVELRQAGITAPILVFGGILGRQVELFLEYDLELTASSISKLKVIEATAAAIKKRARVHLKLDTGMERIGVHWYNASDFIQEAFQAEWIEVTGIFSHLALSESQDGAVTAAQLHRFHEALDSLTKRQRSSVIAHIANSGGALSSSAMHLDMVRVGAALYGIVPAPHLKGVVPLKPALRMRSEVVYFKVVRQGAGVSYGHCWYAPRDTRVVTVPIGYGDGFSRRLSNCGSVLIRGIRYPIVGRVCMDQLMVDIGPEGTAYTGDEVVLIGKQGQESIAVTEIADLVDTDPRDVLTSTNLRLPRVYRGDESDGVVANKAENG